MSEPLDPAGVTSSGAAARGGWEFLEILATVILAAESLRVVGSVVSGIIFAATAHVGPFGEQQLVGSAMVSAANFSDGPGIVLLLVSFALVWWRAEYWTKQVGPDGAVRAAAIASRSSALATVGGHCGPVCGSSGDEVTRPAP